MLGKLFVLLFFSIISISLIPNQITSAEEKNTLSPKIIDIKTSPVPIINQCVTLRQRSSGELLIEVEAENIKEVRFWTVPVKNKSWQDSWEHRKLINNDSNGTDGWSSIFYYGEENLISFIVVEAIGENNQTDKRPFYVVYKK